MKPLFLKRNCFLSDLFCERGKHSDLFQVAMPSFVHTLKCEDPILTRNISISHCPGQRMNTAAYLKDRGWRGDGHALHSNRGIAKPIHICRKANVLGVGKKQHDAHADQWWARAFDDTLKGLKTTTNDVTGKTERVSTSSNAQALQTVATRGPKWFGQGGLYSNFVKGESLSGTLTPEEKLFPEKKPQSGDRRKQRTGSDNVDLTAGVVENVKRSKMKQLQREGDVRVYTKSVGLVDATQQDPEDVTMDQECRRTRKRPIDTNTNGQRRHRKREKKAKKSLEDSECELPAQPRVNANSGISTSGKPKEPHKERLHIVEDTDFAAARPCNASKHGNKKYACTKR